MFCILQIWKYFVWIASYFQTELGYEMCLVIVCSRSLLPGFRNRFLNSMKLVGVSKPKTETQTHRKGSRCANCPCVSESRYQINAICATTTQLSLQNAVNVVVNRKQLPKFFRPKILEKKFRLPLRSEENVFFNDLHKTGTACTPNKQKSNNHQFVWSTRKVLRLGSEKTPNDF